VPFSGMNLLLEERREVKVGGNGCWACHAVKYSRQVGSA
jgi:hypothetical protein